MSLVCLCIMIREAECSISQEVESDIGGMKRSKRRRSWLQYPKTSVSFSGSKKAVTV